MPRSRWASITSSSMAVAAVPGRRRSSSAIISRCPPFRRWPLRGAEPEGLPTLEIGHRMITRASNVTRIIDRLELKNLASRKRDLHDRRVVQIRITSQGLKLLSEMQPIVFKTVESALAGLTDPEANRLSTLLEKVRGSLDFPIRR